MIICAFFISTLCTKRTIQTTSQRNQCYFGSSVPFPLKVGSLTSVPSIRVALGLFTGLFEFTGFTGVADGISCAPILTLILLAFSRVSGEGLLGLTLGDLS